MTLVIPSEHSAQRPPERKQSSNSDVRRRTPVAKYKSTGVLHSLTGPAVLESNRPNVVQRHVAKERVAAQVECSELRRINAPGCHHCAVSDDYLFGAIADKLSSRSGRVKNRDSARPVKLSIGR